ncbi:DUF2335 domain-containing protein [Kordiimonas sp.]|uniref:DUF2335 domain-containing protein n=1 Tax=Kordiimonas sp. TaxID=1970157 RepID=UPI003A90E31A
MKKKPVKTPAKSSSSKASSREFSEYDAQEIIEKLEAGEIELEQFEGEIEKLPNSQQKLVTITMAKSLRYQGPLPLASELRGYEEVLPGAADRIITMAEKEQGHRQRHDDTAQRYYFVDRMTGFVAGFILLLGMVGASVYCIYIDKADWSLLFMGAGVLGLIAKFLPGKHRNDK